MSAEIHNISDYFAQEKFSYEKKEVVTFETEDYIWTITTIAKVDEK